MTSDGLLVLKCLFETIWRLFTSWHIPGTETTPAAFFMFIAVCGLALKFLYRVAGVVPDVSAEVGYEAHMFDSLPSHAPALGTRAWEFYNDPGTRSHR